MTVAAGGDCVTYDYDKAYQLTSEVRKDSGDSTLYSNDFWYDLAGNRTKLHYHDGTNTTTTIYGYNVADQLTKESQTQGEASKETVHSYDANGNLTRRDDGTNAWSYSYSATNRLTKQDAPGTASDSSYTYDTFSRRIRKTVDGTTTKFAYGDWDVVAEYDGSDTLLATYVTPGMDRNISMTRGGATYYFVTDALGSIRQLLDANQATQNAYDYFAFGRVYATPTENVTNTRRFTAREYDTELGWQSHRHRYYLLSLGRWNRRDPAISVVDGNLMVYAHSCPILLVDLLGLWDDYVLFQELVNHYLGLHFLRNRG